MDKIKLKNVQLERLKVREKNIIARGKYRKSPGVLKKVQRQIQNLTFELGISMPVGNI